MYVLSTRYLLFSSLKLDSLFISQSTGIEPTLISWMPTNHLHDTVTTCHICTHKPLLSLRLFNSHFMAFLFSKLGEKDEVTNMCSQHNTSGAFMAREQLRYLWWTSSLHLN